MKYGQHSQEDHLITTYDFATDSFGHASTYINGASDLPGFLSVEEALGKLDDARMRLVDELQKRDTGEPFDFRFIYGHEPEGQETVVFQRVNGRLWRRA